MKKDQTAAIFEESTLPDLKARAERGDSSAQADLGCCYEMGLGVKRSIVQAVRWYKKAATAGNAAGMNNLAGCYFDGNGVKEDQWQALQLWRKAAKLGDESAVKNLDKFRYHDVKRKKEPELTDEDKFYLDREFRQEVMEMMNEAH